VATGYMVHEARRACQRLEKDGLEVTLVDLYSMPFDARAIASLAHSCGGRVLTVEDNFGGGFGTGVAAALAETDGDIHIRQCFVRRIPKSGRTPEDVLRYLGLSADDIAREAHALTQAAVAHG
jgi:transketolase